MLGARGKGRDERTNERMNQREMALYLSSQFCSHLLVHVFFSLNGASLAIHVSKQASKQAISFTLA